MNRVISHQKKLMYTNVTRRETLIVNKDKLKI